MTLNPNIRYDPWSEEEKQKSGYNPMAYAAEKKAEYFEVGTDRWTLVFVTSSHAV
jgi:hypothetical protein